jgi:hypothetical protein
MWQCCRHPIRAGWWMENGGDATLVSYGQMKGEPVDVRRRHLRSRYGKIIFRSTR